MGHLEGFMESTIQKPGKAVKRLDRLLPNLAYVCGIIYKLRTATLQNGVRCTILQNGDRLDAYI